MRVYSCDSIGIRLIKLTPKRRQNPLWGSTWENGRSPQLRCERVWWGFGPVLWCCCARWRTSARLPREKEQTIDQTLQPGSKRRGFKVGPLGIERQHFTIFETEKLLVRKTGATNALRRFERTLWPSHTTSVSWEYRWKLVWDLKGAFRFGTNQQTRNQ